MQSRIVPPSQGTEAGRREKGVFRKIRLLTFTVKQS